MLMLLFSLFLLLSSCEEGQLRTSCRINGCDVLGARKCAVESGEALECTYSEDDGCLEWGKTVQCGERQECSSGACVCVDQCEEQGLSFCDEDNVVSCTSDQDGCLFRTVVEDCTVSGRKCVLVVNEAICE